MIFIVTLIAIWQLVPVVAGSLAEAAATIIAVVLAIRQRRLLHAIKTAGRHRDEATIDNLHPTRAERRLLAAALRHSIRLTAFTSLFPQVTERAQRIARFCSR